MFPAVWSIPRSKGGAKHHTNNKNRKRRCCFIPLNTEELAIGIIGNLYNFTSLVSINEYLKNMNNN